MGKTIYDATKDPKYSKPFIDVDEPRERVLPDGQAALQIYARRIRRDGSEIQFLFSAGRKVQRQILSVSVSISGTGRRGRFSEQDGRG